MRMAWSPLMRGFCAEQGDDSGELDYEEFYRCVREGGKIQEGKMSDSEIRQLFKIIDEDGSGTIDIGEMTEFIWGEGAGHVMGSLEAAMDIAHRACDADHAGDVVEAIRSYEGAAMALRHYGEDTAVRPTPHGSCVYRDADVALPLANVGNAIHSGFWCSGCSQLDQA